MGIFRLSCFFSDVRIRETDLIEQYVLAVADSPSPSESLDRIAIPLGCHNATDLVNNYSNLRDRVECERLKRLKGKVISQ